MSDDALDRLRKRRRPSVPARDTSLTPGKATSSGSADTSTSRNLNSDTREIATPGNPEATSSKESRSVDTDKSRYLEAIPPSNLEVQIPEPAPLDTKQSTMRLERDLSDRLQALCRNNKVCREALIEAMFEYIEADSTVQDQVLSNAKTKNEHRQKIANHKRAQSMMKRFLNPDQQR